MLFFELEKYRRQKTITMKSSAAIKYVIISLIGLVGFFACHNKSDPQKPNVIIVMTDDQGIGDMSYHGNPYLKTPNLDAFARESVSLTNFHVSPLCTPTRSAIITGQYPIRNGAWATFKGRDAIMHSNPTIADIFKENGYRTALFGKWHLGDNYPSRPTDCGFDYAVHHSSGGVGELSDYWGNNYFDDVYSVNNEPKQFEGYCTDVWFDETIQYIESNKEDPFFIYLATNAPHSPLIVADKYKEPYKPLEGSKIESASYLGMIANIDKNFGKLDAYLKNSGLAENTILIFLTDNGTQFGFNSEKGFGFNKGFVGNKSDKEEGGHRVPFYIRWPKVGISGEVGLDFLSAHIDLIPTLAGLCNLYIPDGSYLDGVDLAEPILNKETSIDQRTVFIHHRQDWRPPDPIKGSCIMQDQWRLINGNRLYDMESDQKQTINLISENQELINNLLKENAVFIEQTQALNDYLNLPVAKVGTPYQEEIKLTIQHAIGEAGGIWKAEHVAAGVKNSNSKYAIEIIAPGDYVISCRRWPKECPGPFLGIPLENPKNQFEYQTISPEKVRIRIFDKTCEQMIHVDQEAVEFKLKLPAGRTMLETVCIEGDESYGVYYTYLRRSQP